MSRSITTFTISFRMKSRFSLIILAALLCCISCVEKDHELGGSLIPVDQTYRIYRDTIFFAGSNAPAVSSRTADSLSGYSDSRITIGSIMDGHGRLSRRSCAMTLIPMYDSVLYLGVNPEYQSFKMIALRDSISVADMGQENILQNVRVYELSKPLDPSKDFDCNAAVSHGGDPVTKGIPVLERNSNLVISFADEFGKRFLELRDSDVHDMDTYLAKFPGLYLETDDPYGRGGRFNLFDLQLAFDSTNGITGNFAELDFSAEFDGQRKDTTLLFYFGALDFYDIDSLVTKGTSGKYPQYCLNVTSQETAALSGKGGDKLYCEGGGGLKPVVNAKVLADLVSDLISSKGGDPSGTVINKASLVFPYAYDAGEYDKAFRMPEILSPTCRLRTDTTSVFMGLTDASSSDENQGDIDRSNLCYSPDITYHMQELLKMDEDKLAGGNYDIWLLNMANETVVTENQSSSDMNDYYQYLAYQSYYNNMYGGYGGYGYGGYGGYGYGGYGGYGYGGYGGYGYNNYYSYMMAAMYAGNSSSSTTSVTVQLDKDRYYWAELNGPDSDNPPMLVLTYSIPNGK